MRHPQLVDLGISVEGVIGQEYDGLGSVGVRIVGGLRCCHKWLDGLLIGMAICGKFGVYIGTALDADVT